MRSHAHERLTGNLEHRLTVRDGDELGFGFWKSPSPSIESIADAKLEDLVERRTCYRRSDLWPKCFLNHRISSKFGIVRSIGRAVHVIRSRSNQITLLSRRGPVSPRRLSEVDCRMPCHTVLTSAGASFPLSGRRWKTRSYGVVMFRLVDVQA